MKYFNIILMIILIFVSMGCIKNDNSNIIEYTIKDISFHVNSNEKIDSINVTYIDQDQLKSIHLEKNSSDNITTYVEYSPDKSENIMTKTIINNRIEYKIYINYQQYKELKSISPLPPTPIPVKKDDSDSTSVIYLPNTISPTGVDMYIPI